METRNIKPEDLFKDGRIFEDVKAILKTETVTGSKPNEDRY